MSSDLKTACVHKCIVILYKVASPPIGLEYVLQFSKCLKTFNKYLFSLSLISLLFVGNV